MEQIHQRFDRDRWSREFSLSSLRAEARRQVLEWARERPSSYKDQQAIEDHIRLMGPSPDNIFGPKEMAEIEQLRDEMGIATLGPGTPTDVFVWGLGEPPNRAGTKIGGVPYRPADRPWPTRPDGTPMGLLAQFCFADSRDLAFLPGGLLRRTRPLPGDVLLIFAPGAYFVDWDDDAPESLVFEWYPLGLSDLVRPEDVPEAPFNVTATYGEIHRSLDYPEPPEGHPAYEASEGLRIIKGTKIGGLPSWEQAPADLPGRHLCTLGSLNPYGERFPLLNVPKNPKGNDYVDEGLLMLGDVGLLYLFIDKEARIHWTTQFG